MGVECGEGMWRGVRWERDGIVGFMGSVGLRRTCEGKGLAWLCWRGDKVLVPRPFACYVLFEQECHSFWSKALAPPEENP